MKFSCGVVFPPALASILNRPDDYNCDGQGLTTKFAKGCCVGGAVTTPIGGLAKPSTANPPACCSREKAPAVLGPGPPG
jgi:hypothetical protein